MSTVLQAKELGRWYGQVAGLTELTVDVPPGVTGLIGPNGAGKSTFLKLIVGELRPSRGSIQVLGEEPFANRRLYRRLGFAPQQDAFYDEMTGLQMVRLLLRLAGFDRGEAERRAREALDRVELEEGRDRRIGTYSKGMRQRVKLAQAIAHDPELLVMDEPLNGLDPLGRRLVLRLLGELAAEGVSVIVSSHVLHEVENLTRQVILLHRGRLLAQGEVGEIRRLLSQHPARVAVRARRPRELARTLLADELVRATGLDDDGATLHVETSDLEGFFSLLTAVCSSESYGVSSVESLDAGLEAVFDYLVA